MKAGSSANSTLGRTLRMRPSRPSPICASTPVCHWPAKSPPIKNTASKASSATHDSHATLTALQQNPTCCRHDAYAAPRCTRDDRPPTEAARSLVCPLRRLAGRWKAVRILAGRSLFGEVYRGGSGGSRCAGGFWQFEVGCGQTSGVMPPLPAAGADGSGCRRPSRRRTASRSSAVRDGAPCATPPRSWPSRRFPRCAG